MENDMKVVARSILRRFVPAFGILIAVLSAFPTSSSADSRHRGHGRGYGHSRAVRVYRPPLLPVPRRIVVENRRTYQPFFTGRIYYGPHHHYHAAYRFPVFVNGVVVYRPYSYCDDQIFVSNPIPLPRLALNVVFGAPVRVIGPDFYPLGGYVYYHHENWDDDDD